MLRWTTLSFCLLLLLAPPKPAPQSARWEVIGPGGGGALFSPAVSPHDPNRVAVACDMTGAYLSANGGASWTMVNLHARVRFLVFDPNRPDTLYAKSIGLWRSTDGGRTWSLIYPDPAKVTGVAMADDHATESLLTSAGEVTALAIDPVDSNILYASIQRGNSSVLHSSRDWGKTWERVADLPDSAVTIHLDPRSAAAERDIYVVTKRGLLVRHHGESKLITAPPGIEKFMDVSMGLPPGTGWPIIYAISDSKVFVSEDAKASWRESQLPGRGARLRAIAASIDHPEVAYVSYSKLKQGLFGTGKSSFGVARTGDRGLHWELVRKESDEPAPNLHDAWLNEFFGPEYAENPIDLGVAPGHPEIAYTTDYGRVLRTIDGGKNWEALYSTRHADHTFSGRGLEATTSYGVHFDPFDPKRIFISFTDIGLFRSENGGKSWTSSTAGVPHAWLNTTYWMVFDPVVRGRAWAAMSGVHDLPRAKMWQKKSPSTYQGGVMLSEDGGSSWRISTSGMPPTAVTHILLDPKSSPQSRVLYAAAFGRGVYKSTDGGRTWLLKNTGFSGAEPLAWRLSRDSTGTLYLVVVRRSEDGSIGNENDGGVYRSTDGAEHWTRLTLPRGVNGPTGLSADPRDPRRLYLAAWARNVPPHGQDGGIYLSLDSGKTWRNVLSRDQHVYDVTIDERDPRILYAVGFESSAWRSTDRGVTWNRIRGFDFKRGHRVIPDPIDPAQIYITTFGSGVWHGPAAGDKDAVDAISTALPMPTTDSKSTRKPE
jgi:photosystem II stability/assembly factor-like uncharacterized protein